MKKKSQKKELIASFYAVSSEAKTLNNKLAHAFEDTWSGYVARREFIEILEVLRSKVVTWHGVQVLTLTGWRSDISPKLQLVKLEGKYFFGYTACGGLAPFDGDSLTHFKMRQTIDEFLADPIGYLKNIATQ